MTRPSRPPLYGLEVRRRRRRRRLPAVRRPPLYAVALTLVAVLAAGSAFVAYRLWPLTDRSAGVIAASVGSGPQTDGGAVTPIVAPLRPLTGVGAARVHIPGVRAQAGIVVDSASGSVLWTRDAHRRLPIASLTKLMTALLALPPAPALGHSFAVTHAMLGVPGYTIGLRAGARVTSRRMIAATLIASANDAANVLAVHRAGSLARFVGDMNTAAARFGLADTHYSNPSGIFDAGNHSSAWDVADLSRRVLQQPFLRSLVGERAYQAGAAVYVNRNRLLWTYTGAIGIKTGSTTAAGNCLAVAARRRGRTVIGVLLHVHGDEFAAASRLLDWGFRHDR